MNIQQALEYIHSVSWKGSVPGLERITRLLTLVGNPEKNTKYVHVVGTNGKGSTASMIASVLKEAGYTVGLYTSPYIISFNERMQINGNMISDDELCQLTEYIKPYADSMEDRPTEFELISAIAFLYFSRNLCDIVVLEAGMGGEFDATNVIPSPEVAVFTNIGLDHTDFLGDTVEKIALTKSGVIKHGCDCVVYPSSTVVEQVIRDRCTQVGASFTVTDFKDIRSKSISLEGQRFDWNTLTDLFIPLLGTHQLHNAANALTALEKLGQRGFSVCEKNIRNGLLKVYWPGRFELLGRSPLFIVDGGHNPQCMEALAANIRDYLPNCQLTVLTGVLADKDYTAMYDLIVPYVKEFCVVTPPSPRALPAVALAEKLSCYDKPVTVCESVKDGVEKAIERSGKNGTVLAFGSLYMVGDIKKAVSNTLK